MLARMKRRRRRCDAARSIATRELCCVPHTGAVRGWQQCGGDGVPNERLGCQKPRPLISIARNEEDARITAVAEGTFRFYNIALAPEVERAFV